MASSVSTSSLERVAAIAAALRPLIEKERRSRRDVEDVAVRLGMSVASVYRKMRLLEEGYLASSLVPSKSGRRVGTVMTDRQVEAIVQRVLKNFYLKAQRPTITATVREIHDACHLDGVEERRFPSRSTIRRRIDTVDLHVRTHAREGKDAARATRPTPGQFFAPHPNHTWLIDHTAVDLIHLDEELRLVAGRSTVTLIIDAYTRVCVGFLVSFDSPSRVQVAGCMLHALFPKDAWLQLRGIDHEWPAYGQPVRTHTDNAVEFKSEAFRRGCTQLSIQTDYRDLGEPQQGGLIERFVGTMMGDVHLLPGTTFSNPRQRRDYDSEKRAVMSLPAFERWLALNIIRYNNAPHTGIDNYTPFGKWRECVEQGWKPNTIPAGRARDVFIEFLPGDRRMLRRTGLAFHGLRYWADWFATKIRRGGGRTEFRYDPRDMSRIWMVDDSGIWTPVSLWEKREPFTLAEHLAEGGARAAAASATHDPALERRLRVEMREVVANETATTKRSRRQAIKRRHGIEASRAILGPELEVRETEQPTSIAVERSSWSIDASDVEHW